MNTHYFGNVDILPFFEELEAHPEAYMPGASDGDHPNTKGIILKFPDLKTYDLKTVTEEVDLNSVYYPAYHLYKSLPKLLDKVMELVKGKHLAWAGVLNLAAGGEIKPHEDTTKLPVDYKRIHVVIKTEPGCTLKTGDEELHMKTGEVWWFNNRIMHSGKNESDTNRIHMVLDIKGEF